MGRSKLPPWEPANGRGWWGWRVDGLVGLAAGGRSWWQSVKWKK
ncbi:hypothetical protein [Paenibacillus graminis]|nr:hypothetical protein [Paenibacillus graminis]